MNNQQIQNWVDRLQNRLIALENNQKTLQDELKEIDQLIDDVNSIALTNKATIGHNYNEIKRINLALKGYKSLDDRIKKLEKKPSIWQQIFGK